MVDFVRVQPWHDTAANWTANDPILRMGEVGIEEDTHRVKRGDGTSTWSALGYALTEVGADSTVSTLVGDSGTATHQAVDASVAGLVNDPAAETRAAVDVRYRRPFAGLPPLTVSNPAANPAPPTVAWSGPGGTSPVAGPHWMDSRGGTPVANVTLLNTPLPPLYDTTYKRITGAANGPNGSSLAVEFGFYGTDLAMEFGTTAAGLVVADTLKLWVDDQPVTIPQPGNPTAANSSHFLRLTWAAAGMHRIKMTAATTWRYRVLYAPATATISPTGLRPVQLAVLGDSWIEGGGTQLTYVDTVALRLGRLLGVGEVYPAGQGGTGYVANGGGGNKGPYTDSRRLDALVASGVSDVVVFGSANDDPLDPPTVGAAVTTVLSRLATDLPSARVHVVLPQPTSATATASAGHVANVAAVRQAAQAAPNVDAIIDTTSWLTGTGTAAAPVGDGNRDLFLSSDSVHMTAAGIAYYAQRLAAALAPYLT
jgi:lysophospholipase L1-like esterase